MKTAKQIRHEAGQLFRLCLISKRLDENLVQQVVQRIVAGKRRGYLTLLSRFQRLVRLEMARHRAEVESATPLSTDLQASILSGLEHVYGSGISTSFAHRPTLIGGMRIKVGSDVYDGSVQGGLAALEKSL